MAQKLLKTKKNKIVPKKVTVEESSVVLVGTYKEKQLAWIKKNGVYNYPVKDGDELTDGACGKIKELWLYASAKGVCHAFSAKFVGKMPREDFLAEYPTYAKLGKPKSNAYYVFKAMSLDYGPATDGRFVAVRATDFEKGRGRAKLVKKAVEQFKADGEFAPLAAYLPSDLAKVPHQQLRVCDSALQTDFLDELMPVVAQALSANGGKFRLATVFSGIGAIEQALQRTHVDHEIVFACDNGDQTPFVCSAIEWQECVDAFRKLSDSVDNLRPNTESQRWAAEMIRKQRDTIQALLNGAPAMSKRPERELKDRVQMLHEAIGFFKFRVGWEAEADWRKRKQLVEVVAKPCA